MGSLFMSLAFTMVLRTFFCLSFLTLLFCGEFVNGHGCMTKPNPRGSLTSRTSHIDVEVDPNAPIDYYSHFPAGPRSETPGSALKHQVANAGRKGWTSFAPIKNQKFIWRASVCGDGKRGPYEHLKGGRYYYNGRIVRTYRQGGTIDIEVAINAHHLGFVEMRICDIDKCPGKEISPKCFRDGHCNLLKRAWVSECQTGISTRCGPIDRAYPSRWYLPCYGHRQRSGVIVRYGANGTMKYKLPEDLHCEHCVLHFFWSTANLCNPPGVIDYFDGPDRPRGWGNCPGQAGARGGVARKQKPCGGPTFTEEYYSCADIRIVKNTKRSPQSQKIPQRNTSVQANASPKFSKKPLSNVTAEYDEDLAFSKGIGAVRDIILLINGKRISSVMSTDTFDVSNTKNLSVEALCEPDVNSVKFVVNNMIVFVDHRHPFYIRGKDSSTYPLTWNPPKNRWLKLSVTARDDTDTTYVYFKKG